MASLDVEGLAVPKPVSDLFTDAAEYLQYRLLKTLGPYDDAVAHELKWMTMKVAVQMKHKTYGGREVASIFAFLQYVKTVCDACSIHEGAALWRFKPVLTGLAETVIKTGTALLTQTAEAQELCLKSYADIVNFWLKRYGAGDKIAVVDGDICELRQGTLPLTK